MMLSEYITFRQHLPAPEGMIGEAHAGILELQRMNRDFNGHASALCQLLADKRRYALMLAGAGFACARLQAIVDPVKTQRNVIALRTATEVEAWLLNTAEYPLFGKPFDSYGSEGAVSITERDRDTGMLRLVDGRMVAAAELAAEVATQYGDRGYLWMDRVVPHETLRRASGNSVGCVRLVTATDNGVATPLYAIWKIPAVGAVADNFWREGNMMAELDITSGEVRRVAARGATDKFNVFAQSDTSSQGLKLPMWDRVLNVGIEAAQLTPEIGIIGFDIAITDAGPIIIEANTNPDHRLWQMASGRGFMTKYMRDLHANARQFHKTRKRKLKQQRWTAIRNFKRADLPRVLDAMFRNKP